MDAETFPVDHRSPAELGWRRAPSFEKAQGGQVWRSPQGRLVEFPVGRAPALMLASDGTAVPVEGRDWGTELLHPGGEWLPTTDGRANFASIMSTARFAWFAVVQFNGELMPWRQDAALRMMAAGPRLFEALRKARGYFTDAMVDALPHSDPVFGVLDEIDEALVAASHGTIHTPAQALRIVREAYQTKSGERHIHTAIGSPDGGETCGACGLNFRNPVHYREGEGSA